MPHTFCDVSLTDHDLVTAAEGVVWLRTGALLTLVEVRTGEVITRATVPTGVVPRARLVRSGVVVGFATGNRDVVAFHGPSGKQVWSAQGSLVAASVDGIALKQPLDSVSVHGDLVLVDPTSGQRRAGLKMNASVGQLPTVFGRQPENALLVGRALWCDLGDHRLTLIDLNEGRVAWSRPPRADRVLRWGDDAVCAVTTAGPSGKVTRLQHVSARDGRNLSELELPNELVSLSAMPGQLLAVTRDLGGAHFAWRLESLTRPLPEPQPVGKDAWVGGSGPWQLLFDRGQLTIFHVADGRIAAARVATPSGTFALDGDALYALGPGKVFRVMLAELSFGEPPIDNEVRFAGCAVAAAPPVPARVVFAGGQTVLVDAAPHGRITLARAPGDPSPASGAEVLLQGVHEALPGVFRATSWRLAGDAAVAAAVAGPREEVWPTSKPLPAPAQATVRVRAMSPRLQRLASTYAFAPSALLSRLLELHDTDAAFRTWLNEVSFLIEVSELCEQPGCDPCLLPIAGNGAGDIIGLLLLPPMMSGGGVPVGEWLHETFETECLASSFEAFWAKRMKRKGRSGSSAMSLIADRLGTVAKPAARGHQKWWKEQQAISFPRAELERLASTDPARVERALVRAWAEARGEDEAIAALLIEVYTALEWTYPLDSVRAQRRKAT